jgi:hypothetical protein
VFKFSETLRLWVVPFSLTTLGFLELLPMFAGTRDLQPQIDECGFAFDPPRGSSKLRHMRALRIISA